MTYARIHQLVESHDGTRIYAEAVGNPAAQAIVFIHGYACASFHFNRQFTDAGLVNRLYMIRYDVRGHGQSDAPLEEAAYASIKHAQDFKSVVNAFGAVKPILAGWSLGGVVAADLVAAYGPDYILGVILLGSFPQKMMHPSIATDHAATLRPGLRSSDAREFSQVVPGFVKACFAPGYEVPSEDMAAFMGILFALPSEVRIFSGARTQDPEPLTVAFKGGKLPYVAIHGRQDRLVDCSKVRAWLRENWGEVEFHELEGVGHAPFFEAPERTNALILKFVGKVKGYDNS